LLETTESLPLMPPFRIAPVELERKPRLEQRGVILVVEDDEDIRSLLAESLTSSGYSVVEARDGLDALKALEAGVVPRVVVLDLMMPRMNGWVFLERLRADPERADLPVLVTSAFTDLRSIDASAYLAKPFRMDEFDRAIAELCGQA